MYSVLPGPLSESAKTSTHELAHKLLWGTYKAGLSRAPADQSGGTAWENRNSALNLGKVDQCKTLLFTKVEELIVKIRAEAQTMQQELSTLREKLERDINTAVQERTMSKGSFEMAQRSSRGAL